MEKTKKEPIDYLLIGCHLLTKIREELVIPFLKTSKQTKCCGIALDEKDRIIFEGSLDDDGELSFSNYVDDGEFPLSKNEKGVDLGRYIAFSRYSIIHDLKIINRSKAVYEIKCYEDLVPEAIDELCKIWALKCTKYLRAIADNPLRALSLLLEDDHPYLLYSAVLSLSYVQFGEFTDSLAEYVGELIALYDYTHDEKVA